MDMKIDLRDENEIPLLRDFPFHNQQAGIHLLLSGRISKALITRYFGTIETC